MEKVNIKSYLPFISNEVKSRMSYKVPFFIYMSSQGFTVLVSYFLWKAIYQSSLNPVLGGFDFDQMTGYVIISFFTSAIASSSPSLLIAREVADGSIAMNLLKPISYRGRVFAVALGELVVTGLIISIPFMALFTYLDMIQWPGLYTGIMYIISVLLSFGILFTFTFCFSMLAFYTTYFFGLNIAFMVFVKFFSGALIPISFFPGVLAKVFLALPFASMNYTPVMIYLGKMTGNELYQNIALQLFWVIIFYGLGSLLWQHAIKRLTILGG
ncbi:MAG: ABC transporter permease [Lachnotalea sp.]